RAPSPRTATLWVPPIPRKRPPAPSAPTLPRPSTPTPCTVPTPRPPPSGKCATSSTTARSAPAEPREIPGAASAMSETPATTANTEPQAGKINLLGLSAEKLADFFAAIGEKRFRVNQVLKWMHQRGVTDFALMTDLSKTLRDKLRSEEHTSELQSRENLVCRLLLEKNNNNH